MQKISVRRLRRPHSFCSVKSAVILAVVFATAVATGVLLMVRRMLDDYCQLEDDDDVDALAAAVPVDPPNSSSLSPQPFSKTCFSPVTSDGTRHDFKLDSKDHFQRFNVSFSNTKPYTSIIHRIWKTNTIPVAWTRGAKSCINYNRQFVYCHWTDADLLSFVASEFPWFLATYLNYAFDIQRADAARYLLLYRYGGTYIDLDIVCLAPLDVVFGSVPRSAEVVLMPAEPFGVAADYIGFRRPRDPVARHVVSGLRRSALRWYPPLPYVAVMFGTGPVYLTSRIFCDGRERVGGGIYVLDTRLSNGIYFGHLPGGTWHQWDGRIIWSLFQLRRRLHIVCLWLSVPVVFCLVFRRRKAISNFFRRCYRK